jgi:hypothetical protein
VLQALPYTVFIFSDIFQPVAYADFRRCQGMSDRNIARARNSFWLLLLATGFVGFTRAAAAAHGLIERRKRDKRRKRDRSAESGTEAQKAGQVRYWQDRTKQRDQ